MARAARHASAGPDVFAALANPVRRAILTRLCAGPCRVTELTQGFAIGRPALSEHLRVLRLAGIVREERRGRERHYHLDPRPLAEVGLWLEDFRDYWNSRIAALEELLEDGRA